MKDLKIAQARPQPMRAENERTERKMTQQKTKAEKRELESIKKLVKEYNATGRCAWVYPRLKKVSLNGFRGISFKDASKRIIELLQSKRK